MFETHHFYDVETHHEIWKVHTLVAKPNIGEHVTLNGILYQVTRIIHSNQESVLEKRTISYYVVKED